MTKNTSLRIWQIIAIGGILSALFLKLCTPAPAPTAALQAARDSAKEAWAARDTFQARATNLDAILQATQMQVGQLQGALDRNTQQTAMAQSKLNAANKQVNASLAALEQAQRSQDTLQQLKQAAKLAKDVPAMQKACQIRLDKAEQAQSLLMKQITAKDKAAEAQAATLAACKKASQSLGNALTAAQKVQTGPKRRVLVGLEGTSTATAFHSIFAGVQYEDRIGNQFGGAAGLQTIGGLMFKVSYYKTISFRRR